MEKSVGILCPVSVLPSKQGIGDFGKSAYDFIDKLYQSHITTWQILPLNPLGYGNSPYQPLSSKAGDEIYIDVNQWVEEGLLTSDEIYISKQQGDFLDYIQVRKEKEKLYQKAFHRFQMTEEYQAFIDENSWVYDYAVYRVFKNHNQQKSWLEWQDKYKYYNQNQSFTLTPFLKEIDYQIFLQYYFFLQWNKLKDYAHQKGISIIGDMPIYVGLDSADVWMNQECFLLEQDGTPSFVAGVPPDYFSQYGQRWGNPIYDWEYLENHDFDFWVERLESAMNMYDMVRIDHFRGFDTYWKIPESEPTAVIGEWVEAPGYALFDTLYHKIPHLNILAEDLGDLREEVYTLRDYYHLKGMYVFQFHYQSTMDLENLIVYTGTHDNDTLKGWIDSLEENEYKELYKMIQGYKESEDYLKVIHYCLKQDAPYIIIPVWDLMGLGSEYRFNKPGTIGSYNWEYHMVSFDEFDESLNELKHMMD